MHIRRKSLSQVVRRFRVRRNNRRRELGICLRQKKFKKKKWSKLDANVVGSWPCVHPFSFTRITSALNLSFCYAVRFRDKIRPTQRPGGAQYENISVKTAQNFYFFFLVSALVFKIKLKEFQFQRSEQAGNQVFIDSEPERPLLCLYF